MLIYRKYGFRIAEVWCDEPTENITADIIRIHQAPFPAEGVISSPVHSLYMDLRQNEQDIWGLIQKNTRYEIRRGREKDSIRCEVWDGIEPSFLSRFRSAYDVLARQKKTLPMLPWRYVQMLAGAKNFDLSCASSDLDGELVFHAHVLGRNIVRQLYSVSFFRDNSSTVSRMVGRANRLLHWENMIRFKNIGYHTYDFGGWYDGKVDVEMLRINAFKESFGGRRAVCYSAEIFVSTRARIIARNLNWISRIKTRFLNAKSKLVFRITNSLHY